MTEVNEQKIHPVKSASTAVGAVSNEARQFDRINKILNRGVEEIIDKESLLRKLQSGKQLRIKLGIDPTAPDLHLGHTVPLRKLRQFQDAGHKAVLIIGDFTAKIGDPTGRSQERKSFTTEEVKENMKKYLREAAKVLDIEFSLFGKSKNTSKFEIRYNGEWFFGKEGLEPVMSAARSATINQVIQRTDFKKRLEEGGSVSLIESLYPVMQGYDSVRVEADVEIGGSDQKFNLLMGRQVQKHFGKTEQDIMTLPLIEGTDGIKKMSKSFGNYIGLDEVPQDMYGKLMKMPDNLILKYAELLTDIDITELKKIQNPRDQKAKLAREIVKMYHGEKEAQKTEEEFNKVHRDKELPSDIKRFSLNLPNDIVYILVNTKITSSKTEAWRLIKQGAVKFNNEVIKNPKEQITDEGILQVGKIKFIKIKAL